MTPTRLASLSSNSIVEAGNRLQAGHREPEYIPDFVAETDDGILMVEIKARDELDTQEVQVKTDAAARWCAHAAQYAADLGNKLWKYLLWPHDEIAESPQLSDFLRLEVKTENLIRFY